MTDRRVDSLLIGGGLAAANCARWLRESGAEGSILLVGREPELRAKRAQHRPADLAAASHDLRERR